MTMLSRRLGEGVFWDARGTTSFPKRTTFTTVSSSSGKGRTKAKSNDVLKGSFAAMSCAAVAYVALPNEEDDDLIARDPRDDPEEDLGGNAHERAATLHGFIGERYRVLAHAKPLLPRSSDSTTTTTKHREFGLFSDGTVARRDKKVQAKKESGETIVLNVPDAYIISASTAASDERLGETFGRLLDENKIDTRQATQLFVCAQRRLKGESGWKPYVDFLPRKLDGVPVFWSDGEIERGLKGTVLREMVETQKVRLREEYENVVKNAFDAHVVPKLKEIVPSSMNVFRGNNSTSPLSFEEFLWAKAIFWTRALSLPVENGRVVVEALVPLVDACNHSTSRANARYQLSQDLKSVELRVPSKIEDKLTGEDEIKISYGIENVERAFFTYGFVDDDVKSTILPLVWTDDEHAKTHKSCLELKQLPKIVQLDLENAKKGASAFAGDDDVKEALRILGMQGEQLAMELRALLGVKETLTLTPAERAQKRERAKRRGGLFASLGSSRKNLPIDTDEIVTDHRRLENRGLKRAVETALKRLDEIEIEIRESDDPTSARRLEDAKRYRKNVREILQAYLEASSKHWKM